MTKNFRILFTSLVEPYCFFLRPCFPNSPINFNVFKNQVEDKPWRIIYASFFFFYVQGRIFHVLVYNRFFFLKIISINSYGVRIDYKTRVDVVLA